MAAALLVAAVLGAVLFYNLGGWGLNDDEGSFLYQAWRMVEGDSPYSGFLSSRDPLFLYTGSLWMRVAGANLVAMRVLPTTLTIATGLLVYFISAEVATPRAGLVAMVAYLLHPQVVGYGRWYQPEPFFQFFSVAGLYAFTRALRRRSPALLSVSGVLYAGATLYKLLAVLGFAGCLLTYVVHVLRERPGRRATLTGAVLLITPAALLLLATWATFLVTVPGFYDGVVGVNVSSAAASSISALSLNFLSLVSTYVGEYLVLVVLSLPAAAEAWSGRRGLPAAWQLPTVLGFIVLSRALFPRHLYYLVPSLVVLFAASLEALWGLLAARQFHALLLALLLLPWLSADAKLILRRENATRTVADYIAQITDPQDVVLSDYQELNFHARRASTYSGAEISGVIIEDGTITASLLIDELESARASLVVIDRSADTAHQLATLDDFAAFEAYLASEYVLAREFDRGFQRLAVFRRPPAATR